MTSAPRYLLVGLGNPGARYESTRHNAGFMAMDAIIARHGLTSQGRKFHGDFYKGSVADVPVIALKPHTFMNRSGVSVHEAARFYKLGPEALIVFHDELDLATGKLRIKLGGGLGGHNGLKDIHRILGPAFWRVRLGIDHPGDRDQVTAYVLSTFTAAERAKLDQQLDLLADALPLLLAGTPEKVMSVVAHHMQQEDS